MVQMIGSAIQAYQPPQQSYFGVPGMSGGGAAAPVASASPYAALLASLGGGGGGGLGNINTPMTAADVQSVQAGGMAPNKSLGQLQQGIGYASMANRLAGNNATIGGALGTAGGFLSMYNGIEQGGVMGYGSAAVGGLRAASGIAGLMGNAGMAGTLGAAAGYVAAPLALYSAIKNWQSGDTAGDTIRGAEAGAAIGSVVPVLGTAVGAVIGAAVGALSSAFGGGKTSQEATEARNVNQQLGNATDQQRAQALSTMTPAQAFQNINGSMNAHDSSAGHSEPIQQVFGKNGVGNMFQQMMPAINAAVSKNPSYKNLSPADMYSKVVAPWLKSKGASIDPNSKDVKGNDEGKNVIDSITNVIGDWMTGSVNSKTALGVAGQSMNIPIYGG
jgi:hypothetical protein